MLIILATLLLVLLISVVIYTHNYLSFCYKFKRHRWITTNHWIFSNTKTRFCRICCTRQVHIRDRGWGIATRQPEENLLDMQRQLYRHMNSLCYSLDIDLPENPEYLYTGWGQGG